MGIIAALKGLAPLPFYLAGIACALLALAGRVRWAVLFVAFLSPLRNIIEKLGIYPMGGDLLDIIFISMLIGLFTQASSNKGKIFESSPVNVIAVILILYTFISLILGSFYLNEYNLLSISDPRVQVWKNYCLLPILYVVTLNTIKDKKWVWITVFVMCSTMFLMDYYMVQQVRWFHHVESRVKMHGTFVYLGPNEIAAFYNQYTIILMSLFFAVRYGWKKFALMGIVLTNLYIILFLYSRAAYLGIAVGMFFLFAISKKMLLIPLVIAVIMWQTFLPQPVKDRIEMTTSDYGELDTSSERRIVVWQNSLELFYENPVSGVGFGVFRFLGFDLGDTHNIYLKILAEQGIIGILIFLSLLLILFVEGFKLYLGGDDPLSKALGLGFAMAIIVLIVNNMFGDRWTYMEVSSNLWVFAALVTRLNILSRQSARKPGLN